MTYYISKKTPASSYTLPSSFDTLAEARAFLEDVRKAYAADAPRGFKRERARWHNSRMAIECETTNCDEPRTMGDSINYIIFKLEK